MLLVLDNYDSFVHNLARYFRQLGQETVVYRSDAIDENDIARMKPQAIVLSPGPNTPSEAGCCLQVVRGFAETIPMLGVCLGHQVIGEAFGAPIVTSPPIHGMASLVHHRGEGVFNGLPNPLRAGRYHSLVASTGGIPDDLMINAWSFDENDERIVMGLQHRSFPIVGVQFHPESVLTEHGDAILENFLQLAGLKR